jgi:hypothetical protein
MIHVDPAMPHPKRYGRGTPTFLGEFLSSRIALRADGYKPPLSGDADRPDQFPHFGTGLPTTSNAFVTFLRRWRVVASFASRNNAG